MEKHGISNDLLREVLSDLGVGASTWQQFGDAIAEERTRYFVQGGDLAEVISRISDDFLSDLRQRSLAGANRWPARQVRSLR